MIFVLTNRLFPDAQICIDYCLRQGYVMAGIVQDDWQRAIEYLYRREADVVVVADGRSLDPDRAPRVEVVAHGRKPSRRPDLPSGRPDMDARNERTVAPS